MVMVQLGKPRKTMKKNLLKVTDSCDRHLFFCSTVVTIENGKDSPFWEARWLHGIAPKELAPNLHKVARYKSRLVSYELQNNRWI
jgi:hypothetical protein